MAKFHIFRLSFHTPLHLSKGKQGYERSEELLHSDALKSALFAAILQLRGSTWATNAQFDSFRISSAFPFAALANGQFEYFFPKPFVKLNFKYNGLDPEKDTAKVSKKLKKIQYIGQSLFEKVLQNQPYTLVQDELLAGGSFVSEKMAALHEDARNNFCIYQTDQTQRVHIPHSCETDETGTKAKPSQPFYMEKLYFEKDAGLYFMVDADNDAILQEIEYALHLLSDSGIGTHRSLGNGRFSFVEDTITLNLPTNANAYTNLSLYCPADNDLNEAILENAAYQLVKRGGWMASPAVEEHISLRKRSVYMFSEGSVFGFENNNDVLIKGKTVDLKPERADVQQSVWRDGHAIFLPINIVQSCTI